MYLSLMAVTEKVLCPHILIDVYVNLYGTSLNCVLTTCDLSHSTTINDKRWLMCILLSVKCFSIAHVHSV